MAGAFHGTFQALGTYDRQQNNLTALAVTGTNTYKSTVMPSGMMLAYSYQVGVETGTPTGTFNVYGSNDPRCADNILQANAQWTLVQSVSFAAGTTGSPAQGNALVVVSNAYKYTYVSWVNSAGSGTIVAWGSGVSN